MSSRTFSRPGTSHRGDINSRPLHSSDDSHSSSLLSLCVPPHLLLFISAADDTHAVLIVRSRLLFILISRGRDTKWGLLLSAALTSVNPAVFKRLFLLLLPLHHHLTCCPARSPVLQRTVRGYWFPALRPLSGDQYGADGQIVSLLCCGGEGGPGRRGGEGRGRGGRVS